MKKLLLTALSLIGFAAAQAQVDPLYAQYLNNPFTINPAYAGMSENLNASLSYRKQWSGFDGSPTTVNLSAHTALGSNRTGIGLLVVQDRIGASRNAEAVVAASYSIRYGVTRFSFGLQGGLINYRTNLADLTVFDANDPAFSGNQSFIRPTLGAGMIVRSERFFIGVSMPRMLKAKTSFQEIEANLYERHFYTTAAYIFFLSPRVRFKPSILLKAVKGSPLSLDYNAAINIDEKYTLGVFARNNNAVGFLSQIRFASMYRFGYTFELPLNNSVGSRFTTHEILLGVNLNILSSHTDSVSSF